MNAAPLHERCSGGAPLSEEAALTCADLLGMPVVQGYGMTDPTEVTAFVADRVAPYKKIRRITVVDTIPRSAMGKPLVHELVAHRTGRQR